ncbi:ATPase family associated with various cellular activities (AAA) [Ruminococcaceae bacterium KH2T8]|nr:ATPase family associated with various cellular activities (AAA) [Ruminococcaceae bacterium KH2T8]SMC61425.1 ATPase family associated with various cellular activities (AAA) [Oscillospiraceae bacterium]
MKKKNIINLIKFYSEHNDAGFRQEVAEIANDFDKNGDTDLSFYIMSLISSADLFVPQMQSEDLKYCTRTQTSSSMLQLPTLVDKELNGIINAIRNKTCVNKFIFHGDPGTGKTETVKHIARIMGRELYTVDFNLLIDSHMGQTAKNIASMFEEINSFFQPDKIIILLDEIDSLAMERGNTNDVREMGRATSALMKGLDCLNNHVVLFATTNLFKHFDKALIRRFDYSVNFNRYSQVDLMDIACELLDYYLSDFTFCEKNKRLFKKIIEEYETIPNPGELKNVIKTAFAFSESSKPFDYLKILYSLVTGSEANIAQLPNYTLREKEILTGIPKSNIARKMHLIEET